MHIILTGTGTSHGIPVIACSCDVCISLDSHDKRLRSGALVYGDDDTIIAIDASPEFRIQALKAGLTHLDALLLTHSHADHMHGLDDIRIFSQETPLPVYANTETIKEVQERFSYIFKQTQEGGGKPHIQLKTIWDGIITKDTPVSIPQAFTINSITIQALPMLHGIVPATGWKIGSLAYLTDVNYLPQASLDMIYGVKHLVIDALRIENHETHFNFEQAIDIASKVGAHNTWLTHICHNTSHETLKKLSYNMALKYPTLEGKKIEPAYDGLIIEI